MKKVLKYILHYDHWIIASMALLLTFLLSLAFDAMGLKNPYKKSVSAHSFVETFNKYAATQEKVATSDNVVIVDIGGEANRSKIASILSKIDSLQPMAVGVDVIFARRGEKESDEQLMQVLSSMKESVVLGAAKPAGSANVIKSYFADSLGIRSGLVMLGVDENEVLTFNALQDGDSSMIAHLNKMWNDSYNIKEPFGLREDPILIDYNIDCAVVNADSLDNCADMIEDHIVIVGDASTGSDMKRIPTVKGVMPGVMIHAIGLETLHSMDGYPKSIPLIWNILLAFVLCYVMELLLSLVQTKLPNTRKPWAIFLKEWIKNSYLTNIVLLPMLAVITIFMMNAMMHGRNYQLTLIFTAVVLVVEARNIYKAAVIALRTKHDWAFLRNSLIPK
ncbi:MAG: CHASE2 domain-containing protein [Muribaculaceae bacterium]|nr:CHASE2 domain-containing protein [Muribaculaceae bacterium]